MDATPVPLLAGTAGEPADLVRAGMFATRSIAAEHGLVILAMGLPYWLEESATGFGVLVEPAFLGAVQQEIALYDQANLNWPPPVGQPARGVAMPWFTPLVWAAAVVWMFGASTESGGRMIAWGALDSTAVWRHGEGWRLLTALFLHADLMHVLGNIATGTFVFTQVVLVRGIARGWLELALASLAANAVTAAVHVRTGAVSLGASTAVFAGIGLLTGSAVRAGWRAPRAIRWRVVFAPLSAGLVLLALLGAGEARTDVVAHAAGFAAGFAAGAGRRIDDVEPAQSA